jgi:hypothetical protein
MKCIRKILLIVLTISVLGQKKLSAVNSLSDSSRISLLTVAPGEELYSSFGHTGIRVTDFKNEFDVVFNYGTFDFNQPGFYTNFVKGKMLYMISANNFEDFVSEYIYEKRSITEQTLNLSVLDKQAVFAYLYNNILPENREYYYDFFWDNCATRPRDVFENVLGKRLQYHTENALFEKNKSMHDMLRIYVNDRHWVDYAFDLALGLPSEVTASPRDQTFLPDYLEKYIDCATVDNEPFVISKEIILNFPLPEIKTCFRPIHLSFIILFLAFIVWVIEKMRKTHLYIFDFALFLLMGMMGTLFLSIWLFTSHYSAAQNLNLLWLIPSHVVVAFILLKKKKPSWLKIYFTFTSVLMILLLINWLWLPQQYNIATLPLIFLLSFRSVMIVLQLRKKD